MANHSYGDITTIYFTVNQRIEITVDVECASLGVTFTWSRPENTENSSEPCSGNPHFNTSKSIFRIDNPTRRDEGPLTLSITHPTLKSSNLSWYLKRK